MTITSSDTKNNIEIFHDPPKQLCIATSGVGYSQGSYQTFLSYFGFNQSSLCCPKQEHTSNVLFVQSPKDAQLEASDALITQNKSLVLGIQTADCLPIILWDSCLSVIAAVHGGWKGLMNGILPTTIDAITQKCGMQPESLCVWVGPCIQKDSFEVGAEFHQHFSEHFRSITRKDGTSGGLVDLVGFAKAQAVGKGISERSFYTSNINTYSDKRFYSWRRDRTQHRNLTIIGFKS